MTEQALKQTTVRRSRHHTRPSGLPYLASKLPSDFRTPVAVNGFIYNLAVEVTAGRVESRTAAILGYLSQLAIQTLPLLKKDHEFDDDVPYVYVSSIPRPPAQPTEASIAATRKIEEEVR